MNTDLITAQALAAKRDDPNLVIIDTRFSLADPAQGYAGFLAGHIEGAVYADLNRNLSGPVGETGGRHPLPAAADFQHFARGIGLNSEPPSLVVVYDDSRMAFCARLWWLLRYFGHTQVCMLEGGWQAWQGAGLPVASGPASAPGAGNFVARPGGLPVVDRQQVRAKLGDPHCALIDARDPDRFSGKVEPIDARAGHIPGARNYPWQQLTTADGRFIDQAALAGHWQAVMDSDEVIAYCGSGVTACLNIFALHQLGREDVALYPGSWSDWSVYPED